MNLSPKVGTWRQEAEDGTSISLSRTAALEIVRMSEMELTLEAMEVTSLRRLRFIYRGIHTDGKTKMYFHTHRHIG